MARGELTLVKLRDKIEGRRTRRPADDAGAGGPSADVDPGDTDAGRTEAEIAGASEEAWTGQVRPKGTALADDSLVNAKQQLAEAVEELVGVLREA